MSERISPLNQHTKVIINIERQTNSAKNNHFFLCFFCFSPCCRLRCRSFSSGKWFFGDRRQTWHQYMGFVLAVQKPCTRSTKHVYSQYKSHVLQPAAFAFFSETPL